MRLSVAGMCILWNQLPRDALASRSTVADLPALFADLVRLEIELWDAVEARLRATASLPAGRTRATAARPLSR